MPRSMFERYGGFLGVSRIVSAFYDRVLDSDVLAPYFETVDMRRLIDHQTKFMVQLFGGPASYSNEQLRQVHAHLAITPEAYGEMMALFRATLEEAAIDPADVAQLMADMAARRPHIVAGAA